MADSSVSIKLPNSEVLHFVGRNSCYNLHWFFFFFTGIASISWKCWTSIWFLSCKNVISLRSQTFQESFWKVISEDRLFTCKRNPSSHDCIYQKHLKPQVKSMLTHLSSISAFTQNMVLIWDNFRELNIFTDWLYHPCQTQFSAFSALQQNSFWL